LIVYLVDGIDTLESAMRLYIVRHAIASPHGTPGVKDEDRALTHEGVQKMREAAAGLRTLGYLPEIILSSPLLRARQTAELLLEIFGKGIEFKITPLLAPGGSRQELYREIDLYYKKLTSLMLVGHQPSLGEIAGEIAWGSPDCYIELKKGGTCAIDLESVRGVPKGKLVSLLTTSILRKIVE
jgi:phosphohistidine phosphatase